MKTLTKNSFDSVLDLMMLIPVTVQRAVNTELTHSWNEGLEVQKDDIPGYGVFVTNKIIQSIVGSASSEYAKVFSNKEWLKANKIADTEKVALRKSWIKASELKASQLYGMYEIVKATQLSLLSAENIRVFEPEDDNYDDTNWNPTTFTPFPYDEAKTVKLAEERNINKKDIEERVKLDKASHAYIKAQMAKTKPTDPTEEMFYTYAQKMLVVTSMYYDRNVEKASAFFRLAKDELSKDSQIRASHLEFVCEKIHSILKTAIDHSEQEFAQAA